MIIAIDVRLIGRKRTGDETVFRNLTRALLSIDQETRYILLTDREDESAREGILDAVGARGRANCEVVALPGGRNRFLWNLISVPRFLLTHRVDIFHTQYILPAWWPSRTRMVAHIHDVSFREYPELISPGDRFFLGALIPRTMRRADIVVTPSEFTKHEVMRYYGIPAERIAVVPNASPDNFLSETSPDASGVRRRYRLPDRYLLTVGTLQPRKNIPMLIRAFALIRDRIPDLGLVIVGNRAAHHYDAGIDAALHETGVGGSVIFPGYVEQADFAAVYRASSGLVFPSRYEGFGIPLLEAFATGVPVAASDIPPFLEVGGDAFLPFPPTGVEECAEALYTLVTDHTARQRLIEAGKWRLSEYSWDNSARILLSRYRECAVPGSAGSSDN